MAENQTLDTATHKRMAQRAQQAIDHIADIAVGRAKFRMRIPVQQDDSDILLAEQAENVLLLLRQATLYSAECADLEGQKDGIVGLFWTLEEAQAACDEDADFQLEWEQEPDDPHWVGRSRESSRTYYIEVRVVGQARSDFESES
jgi:hypothetical protein